MFLTTAMAARAQVFTQGFEEEQSADTTVVGWYQYINTQTGDVRELTSDDAHSGSQSLHFFNSADVAGNNWQRAIKFRNLPIEENTAYRLSSISREAIPTRWMANRSAARLASH